MRSGGFIMVMGLLCAVPIILTETVMINKPPLNTASKVLKGGNTSLISNTNQTISKTSARRPNQDFTSILPLSWQHICEAKLAIVMGSNFTSRYGLKISCSLGKEDFWSLHSYRDWISPLQLIFQRYLPGMDMSVALQLHCSDKRAKVALPLPVKALYLWYVVVDNCTVIDHLMEYNIQHKYPDYLAVFEITNSIITVDSLEFFTKARDYQNTSRDFYCGSERLEKIVLRNNAETFTLQQSAHANLFASNVAMNDIQEIRPQSFHSVTASTVDLPGTEAEMNDIIKKLSQDHLMSEYRCIYKNLKFLEESYQEVSSRHHSHFMLENGRYPQLQYFNMSHSNIQNMGPHMLDWRRYFPKMKYMDLSYNQIKYFSALTDNGMSSDPSGVLDLRHNNITTLTPEDLKALQLQSFTVLVDIRNNPIVCDCNLKKVVGLLSNRSYQLHQKYDYLLNLSCGGPLKYKGQTIISLETQWCHLLKNIVLSVPLVIVSCLFVVSLAIIIITIRYRKEIVILTFTRLHISLPCRKVYNNNKRFDAFIAYSELDSSWVFHTLLPKLENTRENNGPGLRLCIHHRDFPVGGCISENILDMIRDSRHTVLILSNNFLKSNWCRYEFKTAFTQSLMEKKQHLIMVIFEELDKSLIDKTLQRCLKTFTYVKTEDKLFWDKIIYALSDRENENCSSKYSNGYSSSFSNVSGLNKQIMTTISSPSFTGIIPGISSNTGTDEDQQHQFSKTTPARDLNNANHIIVTSSDIKDTCVVFKCENSDNQQVSEDIIDKNNEIIPSISDFSDILGNSNCEAEKNLNGEYSLQKTEEKTVDLESDNGNRSLMFEMSPWFRSWLSGTSDANIKINAKAKSNSCMTIGTDHDAKGAETEIQLNLY